MRPTSYLRIQTTFFLPFLLSGLVFCGHKAISQVRDLPFISKSAKTFEEQPQKIQLRALTDSLLLYGVFENEKPGYFLINGIEDRFYFEDNADDYQLIETIDLDNEIWTYSLREAGNGNVTLDVFKVDGNQSTNEFSLEMDPGTDILTSLITTDYLVFGGKLISAGGTEKGFLLIQDRNFPTSPTYTEFDNVYPTNLAGHSDSSFFIVGQLRDDHQRPWNHKFFLGNMDLSGELISKFESYEIDEVYLNACWWDAPNDQLFFTGEFKDSTTLKKDIFIANYNPSSNTLGDVAQIGEVNFDHALDIFGADDSTIIVLGSSEFSGNGIDHPLIIQISKDLIHMEAEVGLWELFSSRFESGFVRGQQLFFSGYKRTNQGNFRAVYGMADLKRDFWLCDGQKANLQIKKISFPRRIPSLNPNKRPMTTKQGSVLELSQTLISELLICLGDSCPDSIKIEGLNPEMCLGETITLSSHPPFEVEWYLNDVQVHTGSSYRFNPGSTGQNEIRINYRNAVCDISSSKHVRVDPRPDASLIGPALVCPGTSSSEYSIGPADAQNLIFVSSSGTVLSQNLETIIIDWAGSGFVSILSENQFGCIETDTLLVIVDSINPDPPNIDLVSWSGDSLLCKISPNIWEDMEAVDIYWEVDGFWQLGNSLDENSEYYFSPPDRLSEGIRFQIRGIDHCGNEFRSEQHKTIYVAKQNNPRGTSSLRWEEYEGWDVIPEYFWSYQGGAETPAQPGELIIPEVPTNSIRCVTISAKNGDLESFSNEVCVFENSDLFISNFVTPNGDGSNDNLFAEANFNLNELKWTILDRWGNVKDRVEGNPKSLDLRNYKPGVYYYEVKRNDGSNWTGWFQVIR